MKEIIKSNQAWEITKRRRGKNVGNNIGVQKTVKRRLRNRARV